MTAHYDNLGVEFLFPENWKIVDEQSEQWPHGVSVQSPESGYWELQIYPSRIDCGQLSGQALAAMREEYADVEAEGVSENLLGLPAVGYNLSFFYLDLLVTSHIRCLHVGSRTYLLICQAESREFERELPVFDAITRSLLTR